MATRDGLRYTRLGWTLGYYVGQFRCRAFGHKWKRYWTDASLYRDIACERCGEVARQA